MAVEAVASVKIDCSTHPNEGEVCVCVCMSVGCGVRGRQNGSLGVRGNRFQFIAKQHG